MNFSTTVTITKIFIIFIFLCGCASPSQDACTENYSTDTLCTTDTSYTTNHPQLPDTITISKVCIIAPVESPSSSPKIEKNQIKLDTFSISNIKHISSDSDSIKTKHVYLPHANRVRVLNDTVNSIDEKFMQIEKSMKKFKR